MKYSFIKSIELTNYRQFPNQKITFDYSKDKNITIIEGKNGFGKSNIFNAINWCFFEIEEHLKPDEHTLPICSINKLKELLPGKSVDTIVKILLETSEGKKEIERCITTYKNNDGTYYKDKSEFKITEIKGTNWKKAPYPEYIISRILPKDMRNFFFIDGEKLRQTFEELDPNELRRSVFDLSQITLLQNAIDHLDKFKGTLRRSGNYENNSELQLCLNQIQTLADRIDELKKERKEILETLDEAVINKRDIENQLEKSGDKNVELLEAERKHLEKEVDDLLGKIEDKRHIFLGYLFKMTPIIFIKNSISKAIEMVSKLEEKHKLPPQIQATFIEDLLNKKKCICGTDLSKNEKQLNILKALLEDAKYSDIVDDTLTLRYQLKPLLTEIEKFKEFRNKHEKELFDLKNEYEENQRFLKEVITKIGNVDSEKIKRLNAEREKYKGMIYEYRSRLGGKDQSIIENERKKKETERIYDEYLAKNKKYKEIKDKIDFCEVSIGCLKSVKEKIMDEIREETEKYTKEYFMNLITEKNFSELKINKHYELEIKTDEFNTSKSLSAGETLCLGYSFMAALRKTSGFTAPIIIDTPLAKIDLEYRSNVANWFKKALVGAQVILLVTDAEYTEDFKKQIKNLVNKELLLKYDKTTMTSEVIKYEK